MDNFLTTLYFAKFENSAREKKLMSNNTWSDDEYGKILNIRNDQSISETRETGQLLNKLITFYVEQMNK